MNKFILIFIGCVFFAFPSFADHYFLRSEVQKVHETVNAFYGQCVLTDSDWSWFRKFTVKKKIRELDQILKEGQVGENFVKLDSERMEVLIAELLSIDRSWRLPDFFVESLREIREFLGCSWLPEEEMTLNDPATHGYLLSSLKRLRSDARRIHRSFLDPILERNGALLEVDAQPLLLASDRAITLAKVLHDSKGTTISKSAFRLFRKVLDEVKSDYLFKDKISEGTRRRVLEAETMLNTWIQAVNPALLTAEVETPKLIPVPMPLFSKVSPRPEPAPIVLQFETKKANSSLSAFFNQALQSPNPVPSPEVPLARPNVISKQQCEEISFDHRQRIGPDSDQKNTSLCWSHAVASILEEQLCRAEPKYCGETVSRSEIAARSYQNERKLAKPTGAHPSEALRYYLNEGQMRVCLDKYGKNPYDDSPSFVKDLKKIFKEVKPYVNTSIDSPNIKTMNERLLTHYKEIVDFIDQDKNEWTISADDDQTFTIPRFLKLALESQDEDEFVEKVLLFHCHDDAMKSFKRDKVELEVKRESFRDSEYDIKNNVGNYKKVTMAPYLAFLREAKKSKHSVIAEICYHPLLEHLGLAIPDYLNEFSGRKESCGSHAIVYPAIRWNEDKKQCQIYEKNSHGKSSRLPSGWHSAEMLLSHTRGLMFLERRGSPN